MHAHQISTGRAGRAGQTAGGRAALDAADAAPRCGARTRRKTDCASPAMPNGRCRMHGGKSTGPRTAAGREKCRLANYRIGERTAEAVALRKESMSVRRNLKLLIRAAHLRCDAHEAASHGRAERAGQLVRDAGALLAAVAAGPRVSRKHAATGAAAPSARSSRHCHATGGAFPKSDIGPHAPGEFGCLPSRPRVPPHAGTPHRPGPAADGYVIADIESPDHDYRRVAGAAEFASDLTNLPKANH